MHAQSANAMIAGPNRGVLLCRGPHYCVELLLHCVGFVPARTFAHRGSWTPAVELRDDALTRLLRPGIAVAIGAPSCHPPKQPSTQGSMIRTLDLITGNTAQRKRSGSRSRVCGSSNLQRFRVQSQNHSYGFALGMREFRIPIVLDLQ
jgi:hypothetical protein